MAKKINDPKKYPFLCFALNFEKSWGLRIFDLKFYA